MPTNSAPTLDRAKDRVVRAAIACLDREGWLFDVNSRVTDPEKFRRLENALAAYKEASKSKKKTRG